ncbi:MAG: hypothetical protein ACXABY_03350 [Candidatus Thorarchaeota archaeon]|jgi:hypothetical protein
MTKYRLEEPRETRIVLFDCYCYIHPDLLQPSKKLTEAHWKEFEENGSIPCEGGGVPGERCDACRFGVVERDDKWEDVDKARKVC